ncbi:MAG: hypothetical protein ACRD4M_06045 [Candidatus Acidiferrales bacterium]
MNSQLRQIAFWIVAFILAIYVAGSLRMMYSLMAGGANHAGVSWSGIAAGFYLRFAVMGFILYLLIRLRRRSPD